MSAVASALTNRVAVNRANSQHSTGPHTHAGKQRASQNALRHGLTARTALLPDEDQAAYHQHVQKFVAEYQPASQTESQLVQELADTSWRINRVPLLEANLLAGPFDIQALATLGLHGARLSRQFNKTLDQLRTLQTDRRRQERRTLRDAAVLHEFHKHKGMEWDPAQDGFVFSREQIERHAGQLARRHQATQIEFSRFGSGSYRDACAE